MNRLFYTLIFRQIRYLIFFVILLGYTEIGNTNEKPKLVAPPTGHLSFTGSIALSNLMSLWIQDFNLQNPNITFSIADPGGIAGINALINGTADMVLVSNRVSHKQIEAFEQRFGYRPHFVPVAKDAVAVYVNALNPLKSITLQQLDAIFSSTLRCGETQPIREWGALGIKGKLEQQYINVYGLTVDTGVTSLFRKIALCNGDFIQSYQALAGPEALEVALMSDVSGIGFSSSAMQTVGTHSLAVALNKNTEAIAPTYEAIYSGKYPMVRVLSIAINQPINKPLSPALQAFIDFVLSPRGQGIVSKAGYVPLNRPCRMMMNIKPKYPFNNQ